MLIKYSLNGGSLQVFVQEEEEQLDEDFEPPEPALSVGSGSDTLVISYQSDDPDITFKTTNIRFSKIEITPLLLIKWERIFVSAGQFIYDIDYSLPRLLRHRSVPGGVYGFIQFPSFLMILGESEIIRWHEDGQESSQSLPCEMVNYVLQDRNLVITLVSNEEFTIELTEQYVHQ